MFLPQCFYQGQNIVSVPIRLMSRDTNMNKSIIDISREFFQEAVKPILQQEFPDETAQITFGLFGQGSEALGLDDELSRDHHWGVRIDALMPDELYATKSEAMQQALAAKLPTTYQGFEIGQGIIAGAGISPDTLSGFLLRSIGIDHAPQNHVEWLGIPEEDIIHVINGEVWHDESGEFTAIRETFQEYYPEPVRLRRMAHWCRYFSGMGTYALKRALLRNDPLYANITFSRSLRWGIQLAFMLDRHYYPYDKWLYTHFTRLPRMYQRLHPIVDEAAELSTTWERKHELLDQISDVLGKFWLSADGTCLSRIGETSAGRIEECDPPVGADLFREVYGWLCG